MYRFWPSVVKPLLDTVGARRLIEIGAGDGRHSRYLALWAKTAGARLEIVDPEPAFDMERLETRFPDAVGVHRQPSLEVLSGLLPADVVLIDGDHNWYTVYHELLALYGEGAAESVPAPIAICHDVEWPYGRRDLYYMPERIPHEHRQPSRIGGVLPEEPGLTPLGFGASWCHAEQEGGACNGVKTAIEDFVAGRGDEFHVVWLPVLSGLAVIVPRARLEASATLQTLLESLELSAPLRSLCKLVEMERIGGRRPQTVPAASQADTRPRGTPRHFGSALSDEALMGMLRGTFDVHYKGRGMLLNPFDMANYLTLLQRLRPVAVVEIGSFEGGRALWLADTLSALGLDARVVTIDCRPLAPIDHPGVEVRTGDARDLGAVLPPEQIRSLGHPLLVIEDSAHDEETCTRVLDYFDPLLDSGDYVVVEDGAFCNEGEVRVRSENLSPPSRAVDAFLVRRGADYEVDASLCDRFGYNTTFNPNGWLRRR